jgi:hypothetical protein
MTILYFEALAAIAVSLSVLMAGAWMVQQRTGNSGWVDTIRTFSLGLVGAAASLWPVADAAPNGLWRRFCSPVSPARRWPMLRSRGDRYRDYQLRPSNFSRCRRST